MMASYSARSLATSAFLFAAARVVVVLVSKRKQGLKMVFANERRELGWQCPQAKGKRGMSWWC